MSEEKPKYSDFEDGIDYRVIKSYGPATRSPIRKSLVYALAFVIVMFLMTRCDGGQVSDLETKVTNLETKVTNLETKVTNLETKVTDLETKVTDLETKKNQEESQKTKGESQKNNAESRPVL
jgi:peptidoglycan hydrolase CwlO-like protein